MEEISEPILTASEIVERRGSSPSPVNLLSDTEDTEESKSKASRKSSLNSLSSTDDERLRSVSPDHGGMKRIPSLESLVGCTDEGQQFVLPKMRSPFEYHSIKDWTKFDWIKYMCVTNVLLLFTNAPGWFYIAIFLFWRVAYNGGIGYLLHAQSHSFQMTKRLEYIKEHSPQLYGYIEQFLTSDMGADYSFKDMPIAFNAWLLFRRFVDIVLANDLICYFVFVAKYYVWPESFLSITFWASQIGGFLLCLFALWGKSDAYRVVGTFAWYWGDFFFLIDQKLIFNRVFAIAPHPMYTLGYTFFYGCSMITRSYEVLAVSLAAHVMQLLFLSLVEDPHIAKTYGTIVDDEMKKQRDEVYHPEKGYFNQDLLVLKNFNAFRSSDILVVVLIVNTLLLNFVGLPEWYHIATALAWRTVHSGVFGVILYMQSRDHFWTRRAKARGLNKREAFENFKRLYNCSSVLTQVTFICYVLRRFSFEMAYYRLFSITIGLVLVYLSIWAFLSSYEVLGDFGWFYGDFFLEKEVTPVLSYSGIYRYFNNPDLVLGFASHYGMALAAGSWTVFLIALYGHLLSFLFVKFVETPHMVRLYGKKVRKEAGAETAVKEIVADVVSENPDLKEIVEKAKEKVDAVKYSLLSKIKSTDQQKTEKTD